MGHSFKTLIQGYESFRDKYAHGDQSVMRSLAHQGQRPQIMVVACCDSRVDPALILQCDPGDLFVVRNVANIVPPYEADELHHGTSSALEFAVCYLKIKHLIILGHSQCGGVQALFDNEISENNDFITKWVSIVQTKENRAENPEAFTKNALKVSHNNCLTFPWIKEKVDNETLRIHQWFFDIKSGKIFTYSEAKDSYEPLSAS